MPIELDLAPAVGARIKVVGIGGGGGNAIKNMIERGLEAVDFIVANTDRQALDNNPAKIKVQVGIETTRGLGAGANPDVGKKSVEESYDEIKELLKGSDMIFVTAGMGGGTGTGGAPVIAKIGQEIGALVVGIVTKPFKVEGPRRAASAEKGIAELRQYVDSLIIIHNEKLRDVLDKKVSALDAYKKTDEILYNATKGISDIISTHGRINVDFADVKTTMKGKGDAIMGIGVASGEDRAIEATEKALNSPLLDGVSIVGAKAVLVNITCGEDLTLFESHEIIEKIQMATGNEADIIHGLVIEPDRKDEISVTVIATGFDKAETQVNQGVNAKITQTKIEFEKNKANAPEDAQGNKVANGGFVPPIQAPEFTNFQKPNVVPAAKKYADNVTAPRGTVELKKYDIPAFDRRGVIEPAPEEGPFVEKINNHFVNDSTHKPTFLRKMMD